MTTRVAQAPVLILHGEEANVKIAQTPVLVLWGLASEVRASQVVVQLLARPPVRRIIGITD